MGPVRHRQLVRFLALLVTLNLGIGAVAIYGRAGTASAKGREPRLSHGARRSAEGLGSAAGDRRAGQDPGGPVARRRA